MMNLNSSFLLFKIRDRFGCTCVKQRKRAKSFGKATIYQMEIDIHYRLRFVCVLATGLEQSAR